MINSDVIIYNISFFLSCIICVFFAVYIANIASITVILMQAHTNICIDTSSDHLINVSYWKYKSIFFYQFLF